jgi:ribonuclease BN (tRNA processing enzyme)
VEELEAQDLHYVAWKVGDGLCLSIFMPYCTRVQIDCGSQQCSGNKEAFERVNLFQPKHLFLSHFHEDHYSGIFLAKDNELSIDALYFPKIPTFQDSQKFTLQLIAMNYRMRSWPKDFTELTIIDKLRKANEQNFCTIPLWCGKKLSIAGQAIDVLWPPEHLLDDSEIITSIKKAIESFEEAIESDDELKAVYEKVQEHDCTSSFSHDSEVSCFPDRPPSKEIPESTKNANRNMRGAANRLSLCLGIGKELIFLGDLEQREIKIVINKLNCIEKQYVSLITPHHGTHWDDSMGSLNVQFAVSSLGQKLEKNYKRNQIGSAQRLDTLRGEVICPKCSKRSGNEVCVQLTAFLLEH